MHCIGLDKPWEALHNIALQQYGAVFIRHCSFGRPLDLVLGQYSQYTQHSMHKSELCGALQCTAIHDSAMKCSPGATFVVEGSSLEGIVKCHNTLDVLACYSADSKHGI